MSDQWKTPRKCEKCKQDLKEHIYMYAKDLGIAEDGIHEYRLDCFICGYSQLSAWDGRGSDV